MPELSALEQGYEVYVVADAPGGVTQAAHEHACQRMPAAGAVPVTWVQVLPELQRDWARQGTYPAVMEIVKAHAGAYGLGVVYAQAVIGAHAAGRASWPAGLSTGARPGSAAEPSPSSPRAPAPPDRAGCRPSACSRRSPRPASATGPSVRAPYPP
ncbi:hypothetical protein Sxan_07820 [Streptomyces xanthophaeus]|uniref:Isochorismatase-like domain-containing protein n=1 Tax=Streptomyces xanthophaeus TaxID=67385 RepID=A0A919L9K4_9ACTN|nr:hypothetical protein Sxan_07820 [Streptomyces xanthophaeus]